MKESSLLVPFSIHCVVGASEDLQIPRSRESPDWLHIWSLSLALKRSKLHS